MKYILDAGHGLSDPGAIGKRQLHESAVNLDLVKIVGKLLTAQGHMVAYTRITDVFVELAERANIANKAKADYFISCHENSCDTPSTNGTETYCYKLGGKAEILAQAVQTEMLPILKLNNRGVKTANYEVLRATNMPAILIEPSFISNLDQEIHLMSAEYKEALGLAIAKGIVRGTGNVWKEPVKVVPTTQGKTYRVVTGSFTNEANADARIAELKAKGFESFKIVV